MYTVIIILILVVSVLLGLVVLVQNSKGGGLISNFGSANQMMGVRQTTDFLEKATWTMAIILVVLCLLSSMSIPKNRMAGDVQDSQMREQIELATPAATAPAAEAPAAEAPAADAPTE